MEYNQPTAIAHFANGEEAMSGEAMSMEGATGQSIAPDVATRIAEQSLVEAGWEFPVPPSNLVFDDGVPLESPRHRVAMNLLIRSAQQALRDRPDSFIGGNMFVYYSRNQAMNRDFRGPDFFIVLDVDGTKERQGWVTWEEDGRYPDVIVELLSPSTAEVDRKVKKDLYERVFKTPDYFIYDPYDPTSLQGWRLQTGQGYQPLQPNSQGWLWCETLKLWLGLWEGTIDREPPSGSCAWLRFYDMAGNLVLLPEEQAEQERIQLIERLRARGIDPDELLS